MGALRYAVVLYTGHIAGRRSAFGAVHSRRLPFVRHRTDQAHRRVLYVLSHGEAGLPGRRIDHRRTLHH